MEQIERITYMEHLLDEAAEAVEALSRALDRYDAVQPGLAELEAYYSSGQWMQDDDDDCAGKLPAGLKRGVLSEDALYDLLTDNARLQKRLKPPEKGTLSARS